MRKKGKKGGLEQYIFLALPLLLYGFFIIYPMLYSLYLSFFDWEGMSNKHQFVGLGNYVDIIRNDEIFRISLLNNLRWCVGTVLLPVTLGLLFALVLNRKRTGAGFLRTAVFTPVVLSVTAVGMMWRWMYDPTTGLINNTLKWFSGGKVTFNWYADTGNIIYYLIVAGSWAYTGMCMIMFGAGIKSISGSVLESAMLDGVNGRQMLFYIVLPQLRNTLNTVLIYSMAQAFKVFDLVYVMTGGGPGRKTNVLASLSYETVFSYYQYGRGSAIAWILTIVLLFISLVVNKLISMQKE